MLQRSSAVWCGVRRQKNTPAALRVTRLNIAPLRSRLRSAARHPQRAADTRRAIHNSTAVGVSEAIPASVPFAETPPREGPATRLMTRPLHRERSDERTRRPGGAFGAARVLPTSADERSRARVWASSSAAETGNSSKRVRDSCSPEAVVEGCAAEPPCALSDAQLLPRRRVAAARAREGEALSQQPAPPQRRTTPASAP